MNKVIEGVAIGVAAGVVVALLLGMYDQLQRFNHRQEQIGHIKAVIKKTEDRIWNAEDEIQRRSEELSVDLEERFSVEEFRLKIHQGLIRELRTILRDRSGGLSYGEKYELRIFLGDQEDALISLGPALLETDISTLFYEQSVFGELYSLEWLRLRKVDR